MQDEVVYLGFKINKNGIFPVKEKIVAIKNAEEPKSISQISFSVFSVSVSGVVELLPQTFSRLYVLVMSRTRFRVNPHSIVA